MARTVQQICLKVLFSSHQKTSISHQRLKLLASLYSPLQTLTFHSNFIILLYSTSHPPAIISCWRTLIGLALLGSEISIGITWLFLTHLPFIALLSAAQAFKYVSLVTLDPICQPQWWLLGSSHFNHQLV